MKKSISDKLGIKPTSSVIVLNSPDGFLSKNLKAKQPAVKGGAFDVLIAFVHNKKEVDLLTKESISLIKIARLFWICYPKKNSVIKSDLTRDFGWDALTAAGYLPVSQVAVDKTWSALRFKQKENIKKITRTPHSTSPKKFVAVLERPSGGVDGAFITFPFDVAATFGATGQIKVKATFDGHPYRGSLVNMGTGGHIIIVTKDIRKAIGKVAGDTLDVTIEADKEERTVNVPDDLKKMFNTSADAATFFNSLSYTNRKEYAQWITSAKKPETRNIRLNATIKKLLLGKKNPSEK